MHFEQSVNVVRKWYSRNAAKKCIYMHTNYVDNDISVINEAALAVARVYSLVDWSPVKWYMYCLERSATALNGDGGGQVWSYTEK